MRFLNVACSRKAKTSCKPDGFSRESSWSAIMALGPQHHTSDIVSDPFHTGTLPLTTMTIVNMCIGLYYKALHRIYRQPTKKIVLVGEGYCTGSSAFYHGGTSWTRPTAAVHVLNGCILGDPNRGFQKLGAPFWKSLHIASQFGECLQ